MNNNKYLYYLETKRGSIYQINNILVEMDGYLEDNVVGLRVLPAMIIHGEEYYLNDLQKSTWKYVFECNPSMNIDANSVRSVWYEEEEDQ